ncbi:hypothetical protein P9272_35055 [Mesorhizobium sp. WSM4976]|uniref:ABC transporter permease subunit n=1 Tax=Mesorhizobium sp. WSM4976 TaxID=3038549 RepID=UPI0024173C86|nr:hypothetical protein [Mesorhizobium sp. WSM4976]MDG4898729.1 hypothetical protein [Mesorhizobium sp. WSM4976]
MSDALTYAVAGTPVSAIVLVVVVALLVPLRRTAVGLGLYGVGSSEQSGYMTGLRVNRLKLFAYANSGFIAALAGIYVSMVTRSKYRAVLHAELDRRRRVGRRRAKRWRGQPYRRRDRRFDPEDHLVTDVLLRAAAIDATVLRGIDPRNRNCTRRARRFPGAQPA